MIVIGRPTAVGSTMATLPVMTPLFHSLDAALNGGRGKIDLLGHKAQRHSVVALNEVQDGTVEFVQRFRCSVVFAMVNP